MIKRYHKGETAPKGIYLSTTTWDFITLPEAGGELTSDAIRLNPLVVLALGPIAGLVLILFLPFSAPLYLLWLGVRKLWRMRPHKPSVPRLPVKAFRVLLPILLVLAAAAAVYAAQPGEIVWPGKTLAPAVFKHATHESMKCAVCHPATFKMKRFTSGVTMEAIDAGKYCGTCHDGKQAFSAADKTLCGRCHVTGDPGQP